MFTDDWQANTDFYCTCSEHSPGPAELYWAWPVGLVIVTPVSLTPTHQLGIL